MFSYKGIYQLITEMLNGFSEVRMWF
jgi:hypothetical protein